MDTLGSPKEILGVNNAQYTSVSLGPSHPTLRMAPQSPVEPACGALLWDEDRARVGTDFRDSDRPRVRTQLSLILER